MNAFAASYIIDTPTYSRIEFANFLELGPRAWADLYPQSWQPEDTYEDDWCWPGDCPKALCGFCQS